jgi:hypothetical protein
MGSDERCECGCGGQAPIAKKTNAKKNLIKGEPCRFISGHNSKGSGAGADANNWKGGRFIDRLGYVHVVLPEHPRVHKNGYVFEHILVLEKVLGRPILPTEACHHIDGNRANNAPGNLMLFKTHGMHTAFHARLRAFDVSGHWDWRKCVYCGMHGDPANMTILIRDAYHKKCRTEHSREYREKRRNLNAG